MDKIQVYDDGMQQLPSFWSGYMASSGKHSQVKVLKDSWKNSLRTFVVLSYGLEVGDVIKFKGITTEYVLKKWVKYHDTGGFQYEIERLDGNRVSQHDLDKLKKGSTGVVKGYTNKPSCNK